MASLMNSHFTYEHVLAMLKGMSVRAARLAPLLALAFANSVADSAILPLLPALRSELGLGAVASGALLSATTLALLATAVPLGLVAGRIGMRRLLVAAAALMSAALALLALADGLPGLLAGRALFGVSFGIVWVVGPARAAARDGAAGSGRLIAAAGAGLLVGPVLSGAIAELAGWRASFAVLALATLPLLPLLALQEPGAKEPAGVRLRDALATARRDPRAGGATLVSALLGVVTGVTALVSPLVLAANGLEAGAIGLALAVTYAVFTATAALVGRIAREGVGLRTVGLGVGALAAAWFLPVLSLSTLAMLGFLVVSAACRSSVNTLVYALGARAAGGEAQAAAQMGLMTVAFAGTALVAPLAAGLAYGRDGGLQLVFAVTAALAMALSAWMLRPHRTAAMPA